MKMTTQKEPRNFNRRYAKEYNFLRTLFYTTFVLTIVKTYFKIFYSYKIEGKENLPQNRNKGKYIYAANHVSILDPTLVGDVVFCPIAFMAKKELFEPTEKLNWLVKRLGAFAVDRTKPEIATFKTVKDVINNTNWSLGIFPQGGTRPYGKLEDIKKGFATIAKYAKADIIPIAIADFDGYPTYKFPIVKKNVTVRIGKAISHTLPEDVIIYEWCKQISEMANYENKAEIPESYKSKETAKV